MTRTLTHWTRPISILLMFFTGAAGLIYEVIWQRYLGNLVGSEARATACVLSVFLAGLATGYAVLGRATRNRSPRQLLKLAGWLEIGICIWAVLFPILFEAIWKSIGILPSSGFLALCMDLVLSGLLVGVPTFLMGGTLPLLTQALSADLQDSTRLHASIYSSNTLGAFAGCLFSGFILIPQQGLPLGLLWTAPLNLIAGVGFLFLASFNSTMTSTGASSPTVAPSSSKKSGSYFAPAGLAFLAGFSSLTLQSLVIRLVGISAGSSEYGFCIVVAVYVLALACGAATVAHRASLSETGALFINQVKVLLGIVILYLSVPIWPYATHVLRTLFATVPPGFYLYHFALLVLVGLILLIAVGAMGRTLPLLFHTQRRSMGGLGNDVGVLYAWNTLGCVLGALAGGYFLLLIFNMASIVKICALLIAVTLVLARQIEPLNLSSKLIAKPVWLAGAFLLLAWILFLPSWPAERLSLGTFRERTPTPMTYMGPSVFYKFYLGPQKILAQKDGPGISVAVMEGQFDDRSQGQPAYSRTLTVNGKSDGNTWGDRQTTILLAQLPMLLRAQEASKVAVVGFGTGMTAGSFSIYKEIQKIDAFEISPEVRNFASYFDFANRTIRQDPRFTWKMGDAYRQLASGSDRYDIISSEPSNPWVAGVERLYTREFFELARDRLTPGGVYSQWIHTYDLSPETLSMVIRTFSDVFPYLRAFLVADVDLILLGSATPWPSDSLTTMQKRLTLPEVQKELLASGIGNIEELLTLEIPVSKSIFQEASEHSLENPHLAFDAGKDFFFGRNVKPWEIIDQDPSGVWRSVGMSQLLLSKWGVADALEIHQRLTKAACKIPSLELFPGWQTRSGLCPKFLAALAVRGAVPLTSESREIIDSLKNLVSEKTTSYTVQTPEALSKSLDWALKLQSGFLPLNARVLIQKTESCLNAVEGPGLDCRVKLIQTLMAIGAMEEASDLIAKIEKESRLPSGLREKLRVQFAKQENARREW